METLGFFVAELRNHTGAEIVVKVCGNDISYVNNDNSGLEPRLTTEKLKPPYFFLNFLFIILFHSSPNKSKTLRE
jgi:hypothetical protein|tara:strand:+ start:52 stop:276 length:225 start_codon:yes stop_codon:yes gene_type:complete